MSDRDDEARSNEWKGAGYKDGLATAVLGLDMFAGLIRMAGGYPFLRSRPRPPGLQPSLG
jgi:hypothetical protein